MRHFIILTLCVTIFLTGASIFCPGQLAAAKDQPLNVMFIAVDDLNDWIGCLGGHPQAKTPNMDRLAGRGVLFNNAHCQAPICNPSRLSLLTGLMPSSTGVYYLAPKIRDWEATKNAVTLIQHFERSGYGTFGAGKIFHNGGKGEFGEYAGNFGAFGPRPKEPITYGREHPLWDWGAFPATNEEMPDFKIAAWTVNKIKEDHDKPFFMGIGFYRPHVPLYAPQEWFDQHPLDAVKLPAHTENDLDDVPQYGQDLSWSAVAPRHKWLVENNEWKHAVQSYLACVTFVDAQVGKLIDALDDSGKTDNTIIVLWGDHGFHLGTKERWGKRSLWEAATKVPLMIIAPGFEKGVVCERPVGLIDLYPTLVELCGLEPVTGLEGHSLVPLLKDHKAERPWPAITTFGQNNHAVRSQNWRYITYADGSEELYDRRKDPNEFTNLAGKPKYRSVIAEHRRYLPQNNQPMAPGSAHLDARPGSAPDIDGEPIFPKKK